MSARSLKKSDVKEFIGKLISAGDTAAPVSVPGGFHRLKLVTDPDDVTLEGKYLYYSAKEFVFPGVESLVRYTLKEPVEIAPVVDKRPITLLGLHPCDINALWMMDAAFDDDPEMRDDNYCAKRELLTIVGIDCSEPCDDDCFCADMGCNRVKGDYDLMLVDVGDSYLMRVGSDKGQELVSDLPEASRDQISAADSAERDKDDKFESKLTFDSSELPGRLSERHDDKKLWEESSKNCFSCGSCNLVCPTCYCFDVFDELALDVSGAERKRRWDGCQLEAFAMVAGGENFRPERSERLRHRIMRKGKYLIEKFGRSGCVGCGRCIRACTADISILEVFNKLNEGV